MSEDLLTRTRKASSRRLVALRSAIYMVVMVLSTCIIAWPVMLSIVLPLKYRYAVMRTWPRVNMWALEKICGVRYTVKGRENLPSEPSIVFAKHSSTWETIALQMLIPPAVYVAKKELLYIPLFGWAMAVLNFLTIDRSAGRRAIRYLVDQAVDRLGRGMWIIIFPEGHRMAIDAEPNYKIGGAMMAARTGAPVVPVAHNAGVFWPRHSFLKWPGEITVSFLPPLQTEGKKADVILAEAQQAIETEFQALLK
ncbi:lysophospholipid acyltransferase family protein [Granulosicoccaceae sp. 1_MG-2023]|nr:lysophospholipid acyltransferase family protein [Granulosicoccaceae sp. 1_MG-2023]